MYETAGLIGGACKSPEPTAPELESLLKYLIENNNRLRDLTRRIGELKDRLSGEANPCGKSDEPDSRAGLVGALRDRLDDYDRLIKALNEETCALETVA